MFVFMCFGGGLGLGGFCPIFLGACFVVVFAGFGLEPSTVEGSREAPGLKVWFLA